MSVLLLTGLAYGLEFQTEKSLIGEYIQYSDQQYLLFLGLQPQYFVCITVDDDILFLKKYLNYKKKLYRDFSQPQM